MERCTLILNRVFPPILRDTLFETENEWQKTELVPIPLLKGARIFFDAKKQKEKNFANLDFGDNPIYPISNPDGQDQEF